MKLRGEKYKKFMEQLQLGRDIICGSDFSKVLEFYQRNNDCHIFYLRGEYFEELEKTEENLRFVAYKFIDEVISNLYERKNFSFEVSEINDFTLTIKCSNKEKFINLTWGKWLFDEPLFDQTFEIII